jgi:deoxyxylulose-5-phosphate synthase
VSKGFTNRALITPASSPSLASRVHRLGIPDHYIEHGERAELLTDLGLDESGILAACRRCAVGEGLTVGNSLRGVPDVPTSDDKRVAH